MGHLRVTIDHLRLTIGDLRVTKGHLRVTVGHPRVTIGHLKVIMGHHRITIGHYFFSISKHKANTTELHLKVRQSCFFCLLLVATASSDEQPTAIVLGDNMIW